MLTKSRKHTLKHSYKSCSTRVNNAYFFKHGKHLGGLVKSLLSNVNKISKELYEGIIVEHLLLKSVLCRLCATTHNGENSTLGRILNSSVCLLRSTTKSYCHLGNTYALNVLDSLIKSSVEKRKNSSRISSCRAHNEILSSLRTLLKCGDLSLAHLSYSAQRQSHIDSCISVGNGKYVHIIYCILVIVKRISTGNKQCKQGFCVNSHN